LQALEDLIVQTEIFLQYSLQNKRSSVCKELRRCFPERKSERAAFESVPDGELVAAGSA